MGNVERPVLLLCQTLAAGVGYAESWGKGTWPVVKVMHSHEWSSTGYLVEPA